MPELFDWRRESALSGKQPMRMNKILIVEDEEALSRVMAEKLKNGGYETEIAKDGAEALPMAKKFQPDLILLDLLLPQKNGFEVLRDLKKEGSLKDVPVIVLSNLDQDEDIKKAMAGGAVDYFVKSQHPINEIIEKVAAHLI